MAMVPQPPGLMDKIIRIEIIPDAPPNLDSGVTSVADRSHEEQVLNSDQNQDEETVQGFTANNNDSNCVMDIDCSVVRVETMHISSSILAIKSPSFSKLFSNGKHVTIRVNESEEAALKELLNDMCTEPLVMDELLTADDSKIFSRIKQCSERLQNLPMTPDSALFYLELYHTTLMADAIEPLAIAAKQYLADQYKDIAKFKEEVMALPLSGIEAILASDDLLVDSEDALFDFVLRWARQHYNTKKERRKVLCSRLAPLIRFPYMTCPNLQKVCDDFAFKHEGAFQLVREALIFNAETPDFQRQKSLVAHSHRRFVQRAYKHRPVKVVSFQFPLQEECVVYLDLKREECATLFPSGTVYSQAFHLGGQVFFLSAECNMDQQGSFHCFDLSLGMQKNNWASLAVDYEFAARSRPTMAFVSKYKGNYTFAGGKIVGHTNLFGIPWNSFIAEDSLLFIDDVLYLRAKLTIKC